MRQETKGFFKFLDAGILHRLKELILSHQLPNSGLKNTCLSRLRMLVRHQQPRTSLPFLTLETAKQALANVDFLDMGNSIKLVKPPEGCDNSQFQQELSALKQLGKLQSFKQVTANNKELFCVQIR